MKNIHSDPLQVFRTWIGEATTQSGLPRLNPEIIAAAQLRFESLQMAGKPWVVRRLVVRESDVIINPVKAFLPGRSLDPVVDVHFSNKRVEESFHIQLGGQVLSFVRVEPLPVVVLTQPFEKIKRGFLDNCWRQLWHFLMLISIRQVRKEFVESAMKERVWFDTSRINTFEVAL